MFNTMLFHSFAILIEERHVFFQNTSKKDTNILSNFFHVCYGRKNCFNIDACFMTSEVTENYTEEDASGAAALDSTEVTENEVENDISDHDSGSSAGSLFPLSQTSESSSISTPSFSDFTDSSSIQSEANISPMLSPQMSTYKLVGDNIDREVRPCDMRSDYQTRSLHYFHTYAVKDM